MRGSEVDAIKICLLIPVLVAGGAERVISELIWHLSLKSEVDVHLILYGKKKKIFYNLPSNISVHQPKNKFKEKFRLISAFERAFFLRSTVKKIKPKTVLSFGEYWNSFVLTALLGLNIPIYISDRSQPNKQFSKFHSFLRKILYPKAAGIIAQTSIAKEIYQKEFNHSNIAVIGNPIRSISSDKFNAKENIVLSVGRLISSKNYDQLIKIFADIDLADWKLIIVGGDALKQNNYQVLSDLIIDLGASDKIFLEGFQKNVDSYYFKSKIFAFTSSSEGFPNVIGEAMSAGMPVVSYDCIAGPSEMIKEAETGYLIPLFNRELFKEKLKKLMLDENLQNKFGERGKQFIAKFNSADIGNKYYEFILSSN